jgi:type II secretory pathway component GspD/PulD (secretin)
MVVFAAMVLFAATPLACSQDTNAVLPTIGMEDVPITSIIDNFSRLSGQNYIFDSRLYGPTPNGPYHNCDGKIISEPVLTFTWKNMTAKQAFARLLKENGLYAVEMQNTPIVQISNVKLDAGIVDAELLGRDTNAVIPHIKMESLTIGAALQQLAKAAGIKVVIDPRLLKPSDDEDVSSTIISFRWENVTARQAIIALCENFGLDIVKDTATDTVRIEVKK